MSYLETSTQASQAGPVVYTYLPQPTTASSVVETTNGQSQNQSSLSTGWVVAIVTMVLLAITLTYVFWNWRKKRNAGRYSSRSSAGYVESQEYMLQRPRAARVRESISNFGRGRY